MRIEIEFDGIVASAPVIKSRAPKSVQHFLRALEDDGPAGRMVRMVPSVWSGQICEVDLPAADGWHEPGESLGCSLYPGMIALAGETGRVLFSYGTSETRTAAGVEYDAVIAVVDENLAQYRERLGSTHDVGAIEATIRIV